MIETGTGNQALAPHVNCDGQDTFDTVWRKVFDQITILTEKPAIGYREDVVKQWKRLSEALPDHIGQEEVRRILERIPGGAVVFIDEFDRLGRPEAHLFADCIKCLADFRSSAKIVIVGVAQTIERLIHDHESIERCATQVFMPRMKSEELEEIITTRLNKAKMKWQAQLPQKIAQLSQGFPHYAHLLGLHSARAALNEKRKSLLLEDVRRAIETAVDQAQASIQAKYRHAVRSARKGALYQEVLLACALCPSDEFGFFAAADVRDPMSAIMKRKYDIPNFAQHLSRFREDRILEKVGTPRLYRYRFANPLMRPFVYLHGHRKGLVPGSYAIL